MKVYFKISGLEKGKRGSDKHMRIKMEVDVKKHQLN